MWEVVQNLALWAMLILALIWLVSWGPSKPSKRSSVTALYYVYIQPMFSSQTLCETSEQAMQVQRITFRSISSSCLISRLQTCKAVNEVLACFSLSASPASCAVLLSIYCTCQKLNLYFCPCWKTLQSHKLLRRSCSLPGKTQLLY